MFIILQIFHNFIYYNSVIFLQIFQLRLLTLCRSQSPRYLSKISLLNFQFRTLLLYISNISRSNPTKFPRHRSVKPSENFFIKILLPPDLNASISSVISVNPYQSHSLFHHNNISQFLFRYFRLDRATPPSISHSLSPSLFNDHKNEQILEPRRYIYIYIHTL